MSAPPVALTFDFGQTLAELDLVLLAERVAERGTRLDVAGARRETPAAWRAYGEAKLGGLSGRDAWCTFMSTLLTRAGVPTADAEGDAAWLFDEQPRKNLWRKPIEGMFDLVARAALRFPLGIVSNSEGKLAELLAELGVAHHFGVIADSGVLGFEKPDPRIFEHAAAALGVPTTALIHVGDAWEADIVGALGVGARAVWFDPHEERELTGRVALARDARELEAALARWDVRF
jgi:HAD superfamily hydrolase (TIGR01509 family)